MVLISGLERLQLYGRYGYVEITKFLMIRIILSCRLSTDVPVFSVCGHLYSEWRITISLRMSVRLEATARDTFSLHGWQFNLRHFYDTWDIWTAVCYRKKDLIDARNNLISNR
jgi:hypothetical protein